MHLTRNETCLVSNETRLARNKMKREVVTYMHFRAVLYCNFMKDQIVECMSMQLMHEGAINDLT